MNRRSLDNLRYFLKDSIRKTIDFSLTDQGRGQLPPPLQRPFPPGAPRVSLVDPAELEGIGAVPLRQAIASRESRRDFAETPLSLRELSFLLWATQGIRHQPGVGLTLRTVPSAGARHALETYVAAIRVDGLDRAIYRYLPVSNELVLTAEVEQLSRELVRATFGQDFTGRAAATFAWAAVPYRMEWRYGLAAHRVILIDAGHVCQNLYLACEAIGAGTCAVAAYDQDAMDRLLGVDGVEEFTIYMAPVGKKRGG